jgi:hypothetical protein
VDFATAAGFAGIDGAGTDGTGVEASGVVDTGAGVAATGLAAVFAGSEAEVASGGLLGRLGQSSIPINTAATISPAEIAVGDRHHAGASAFVERGDSSSGVPLFGGAEAIVAGAETGADGSAGGETDTAAVDKVAGWAAADRAAGDSAEGDSAAGDEDIGGAAAAAASAAGGAGAVTVSSRMAACSQKPSTADSSRPMLCSASTDLERRS